MLDAFLLDRKGGGLLGVCVCGLCFVRILERKRRGEEAEASERASLWQV